MPTYTQVRPGSDLATTDTTRTPSPNIWADCPTNVIAHDPAAGYHFFDDFMSFAETDHVTNGAVYGEKYYTSLDNGVTLLELANTDFGVLQVAGNDTVNDGSMIQHGVNAGYARFGTAHTDRVWFEARFQKASVTDDACGFFLGLTSTPATPATADTILADTTGEMLTTNDFVGFHNDPDDGDLLECVYQEASDTHVDVGDAITTMVAATNYKIGLRYRGDQGSAGWLQYLVDGQVVQELEITSSLAFPDTNHLAIVWATKSVLTAASTMNLDWWRVAAVGGNT